MHLSPNDSVYNRSLDPALILIQAKYRHDAVILHLLIKMTKTEIPIQYYGTHLKQQKCNVLTGVSNFAISTLYKICNDQSVL